MWLSLAISVVLFLASGLAAVILMIRLRPYRTDLWDLQPVTWGASPVWQWNVLNPNNYSGEGRRRLRWIYAAVALQMAGLIGMVVVGSKLTP